MIITKKNLRKIGFKLGKILNEHDQKVIYKTYSCFYWDLDEDVLYLQAPEGDHFNCKTTDDLFDMFYFLGRCEELDKIESEFQIQEQKRMLNECI